MENKHIIIILLVIIIILAAAIGVMLLAPKHVQEPSKMEITSKRHKTKAERYQYF